MHVGPDGAKLGVVTGDARSGNDRRGVQHATEAQEDAPVELPPIVVDRSDIGRRPRPPTAEVRIGDRERDDVVDRLRGAVGSGHLTLDEFAERVEAAWQAAVPSELVPLVVDLPGGRDPGSDAAASAPVSAAAAEATATTPGRSKVIGIMSGADTRGRWRVAPKVRAFAFWGSATVDLRDALMESPVVDIHATAIMGGVTVIVPEGIPVELDGWVLMGGSTNRADLDGVVPGAPVVRVHASGLWGGVDVRTKASRGGRSSRVDEHEESRDVVDDFGDVGIGAPAPRPDPPRPLVDPVPDEVRESRRRAGDRRSPDLPEGTLTIMFTDIVDSTEMTARLGDLRAVEMVRAHDALVRRALRDQEGREVKHTGDGIMASFTDTGRAVQCARAVQQAFEAFNLGSRDKLRVKIGIDVGEPVVDAQDLFGGTVQMAARLCQGADPNQILVSAEVFSLVRNDFTLVEHPARSLKGFARPVPVYELTWT